MASTISNTVTNPWTLPKKPTPGLISMGTGVSTTPVAQQKPAPTYTPQPINFNVGTKQPNVASITPAAPQQPVNSGGTQGLIPPGYLAPPTKTVGYNDSAFSPGTPIQQPQVPLTPQQTAQQNYAVGNPQLYPNIVSGLAQKSAETNPMTEEAYKKATELTDLLTKSRLNQAQSAGQVGLAPIPSSEATGRQAALRQMYETQQAGLGAQLQGYSNLTGYGIQQQGVQQAALTGAGGLVPEAYRYQGFGVQGGGGVGGIVTTPQSAAQAVMDKQMTYDQAKTALGYLGPTGESQLQQALLQRGGNPLQLQAQGPGQQSVLGTIPALQSAFTAGEGIKNTIQSYLSANPQLNPNTLAVGNILQQWIQGKQLTDPKYQTLFNYLNEYTNTLAPILGVGGDPTNLKTQIAQGFLDAAASGKSISQVLNDMTALAKNKIANIQSGATGGGVVAQGGVGGGGQGGAQITTQATDGNQYTFFLNAQGLWQASTQ